MILEISTKLTSRFLSSSYWRRHLLDIKDNQIVGRENVTDRVFNQYIHHHHRDRSLKIISPWKEKLTKSTTNAMSSHPHIFGKKNFTTELLGHSITLREHTFNTLRWHYAICNNCMRFVLSKWCAFLLSLLTMDRSSSVLRVLPSCYVVNLSWIRQIIIEFFFDFIFNECSGVKSTVCLTSHPSYPPVMSPTFNMEVKLNENLRWNTNIFPNMMRTRFSISASIMSPTVSPWMIRMWSNLLQKLWNYWNLDLILPFQMKLIQTLSVKLLPPSLQNLNLSAELVYFHEVSCRITQLINLDRDLNFPLTSTTEFINW